MGSRVDHSDLSQLPTRPILALIRVKDEQVKQKAIIKCSERLNGKIGAGMQYNHRKKREGAPAGNKNRLQLDQNDPVVSTAEKIAQEQHAPRTPVFLRCPNELAPLINKTHQHCCYWCIGYLHRFCCWCTRNSCHLYSVFTQHCCLCEINIST